MQEKIDVLNEHGEFTYKTGPWNFIKVILNNKEFINNLFNQE